MCAAPCGLDVHIILVSPCSLRFRQLCEYRNAWQAELDVPLPELSMGMSHDFEVAIEEGATMIRLGTALFGPRQRKVPQDG